MSAQPSFCDFDNTLRSHSNTIETLLNTVQHAVQSCLCLLHVGSYDGCSLASSHVFSDGGGAGVDTPSPTPKPLCRPTAAPAPPGLGGAVQLSSAPFSPMHSLHESETKTCQRCTCLPSACYSQPQSCQYVPSGAPLGPKPAFKFRNYVSKKRQQQQQQTQ